MATGLAHFGASGTNLWLAAFLTAAFAALARLLRGVTAPGALTGAVICFLLLLGGGWGGFAALMAVFVLTWIATRLGYRRKQSLGIAEQSQGRRASQVFANLSVAALCAGLSAALDARGVFLAASAAALAEAAGDTVSSEIGQAASAKARLITTWQQVAAGTDGAISLPGSLAGILAALTVCFVCGVTGVISIRSAWIAFFGALAGMLADSLLGASLERRNLLNNNGVNFLSTLAAAVAAAIILGLQ